MTHYVTAYARQSQKPGPAPIVLTVTGARGLPRRRAPDVQRKEHTMTTYSNPRLYAEIPEWPNGRHRVTATFTVETHPKRGQRAVRVTTGAPKRGTYADEVRIVDGDDGRTYIASWSRGYRMVSVMRGDMKYSHEHASAGDSPRYLELLELFQ